MFCRLISLMHVLNYLKCKNQGQEADDNNNNNNEQRENQELGE